MKTPYNQVELELFREKLLSQKSKCLEQISFLENIIDSISDRGRDETNVLQNTNSHTEVEYNIIQLSRQRKHLTNIEAALERIENKTYGICKYSGNVIDKARLLAVPTTSKAFISNGKK